MTDRRTSCRTWKSRREITRLEYVRRAKAHTRLHSDHSWNEHQPAANCCVLYSLRSKQKLLANCNKIFTRLTIFLLFASLHVLLTLSYKRARIKVGEGRRHWTSEGLSISQHSPVSLYAMPKCLFLFNDLKQLADTLFLFYCDKTLNTDMLAWLANRPSK